MTDADQMQADTWRVVIPFSPLLHECFRLQNKIHLRGFSVNHGPHLFHSFVATWTHACLGGWAVYLPPIKKKNPNNNKSVLSNDAKYGLFFSQLLIYIRWTVDIMQLQNLSSTLLDTEHTHTALYRLCLSWVWSEAVVNPVRIIGCCLVYIRRNSTPAKACAAMAVKLHVMFKFKVLLLWLLSQKWNSPCPLRYFYKF